MVGALNAEIHGIDVLWHQGKLELDKANMEKGSENRVYGA